MKFTRNSTHQASPGEDDASDSEVDVGRLESQSVILGLISSVHLVDTFRQFLAMAKTATKQKASKQADTYKAEFQKVLEGIKEKTMGALKENAVDV